ncbi:mitochondrial 37S ribosomal protein mS23 [Colletotrichum truncatum]|uniref:37s ribosomal protein rsm25 n=1 Tax=Colletotrichum truncatum TaxID=5467 RepID=A0ACC3ZBT4_COLTU|nr:37s ribosomal protein rsm25 [Colletotrichum truncatum]KAF6783803.1 37s ribosomal protein rsm25 [Colletotrichum truncatum]
MGRQIRPARVFHAVSQELNTRMLPKYPVQEPVWFQVMRDIPPSETLTRPVASRSAPAHSKHRKPHNIYKPPRIVHEEDSLRSTFYKDHPWELARPRMILEADGKDAQRCDWSKGLRQPGLPLTGECVVQRQLWFMYNKQMTKEQAYDTARKEFYALRQEEEIEKRVAREEARHVGAYFGKNRLQIGLDLEDKEFETWKGWAGQRAILLEASRNASYANFGEESSGDVADAEAEPLAA